MSEAAVLNAPSLPNEEIQQQFEQLAAIWREETAPLSSTTEIAMHPAYQQIIGMGPAVVPLLLRELERAPNRWFWALKSITRADPVPPEQRGRLEAMTHAWLQWGKANGYTW